MTRSRRAQHEVGAVMVLRLYGWDPGGVRHHAARAAAPERGAAGARSAPAAVYPVEPAVGGGGSGRHVLRPVPSWPAAWVRTTCPVRRLVIQKCTLDQLVS